MKIYIADISVLRKRAVFQRLYEGMSEARRRRIDRFRFPKDRCRSLGAGVLLRKALADAGVDEAIFVYGEHGKPRLSERDALFTRFWALKESFLKATGLGLTLPLGAFAVDLDGDRITIRQDVDKNEYRFFELDPADEYQYAVCEQNGPDEQPTVEWVDLEKC